jgi:hypothetical protein
MVACAVPLTGGVLTPMACSPPDRFEPAVEEPGLPAAGAIDG